MPDAQPGRIRAIVFLLFVACAAPFEISGGPQNTKQGDYAGVLRGFNQRHPDTRWVSPDLDVR